MPPRSPSGSGASRTPKSQRRLRSTTPPPTSSHTKRSGGGRSSPASSRGLLGLPADGADEGLDRYGRERLDLNGPARAEADGDACDRLVVLRLHDVDEVVPPERRVLRDDAGAHRFDLLVDLLDPARIRLQGLDAS